MAGRGLAANASRAGFGLSPRRRIHAASSIAAMRRHPIVGRSRSHSDAMSLLRRTAHDHPRPFNSMTQ